MFVRMYLDEVDMYFGGDGMLCRMYFMFGKGDFFVCNIVLVC